MLVALIRSRHITVETNYTEHTGRISVSSHQTPPLAAVYDSSKRPRPVKSSEQASPMPPSRVDSHMSPHTFPAESTESQFCRLYYTAQRDQIHRCRKSGKTVLCIIYRKPISKCQYQIVHTSNGRPLGIAGVIPESCMEKDTSRV